MTTETRTDGRPAEQTQTRPPAEPMWTQQYDARMAGLQNPQVQEVRPTGDETKGSFKTSEFWIYLAAVAATLIASAAVGTNANHADYFRADKAWWFISLLTIGYLGSRGLAKAGSSTRSRVRENRENRQR
jgi:hypothetical protein